MSSSEVSRPDIITLTTDFGYKDPFTGEMKGVILTINPHAVLVDITHDIAPQDIQEGAFVIGASYRYFPEGTIHVAVVDPGVGSERRAIMVEAGGHFFIGPDNGIFSYVLSSHERCRVIHIKEERYMLSKDSPTFQGRDLFAPVAAWFSKGVRIEEFGPCVTDFVLFHIPSPRYESGMIEGEVIYVDRFGNAITNIKKNDIEKAGGKFFVRTKDLTLHPVSHYSRVDRTHPGCLINSSGHLEIFANLDSASRLFGIGKGERVTVHFS